MPFEILPTSGAVVHCPTLFVLTHPLALQYEDIHMLACLGTTSCLSLMVMRQSWREPEVTLSLGLGIQA
jgi:hypothetical protein